MSIRDLWADGSPDSLMEKIRASLATEAGIEPERVNLATSLVMRDIRAAIEAETQETP